MAREDPKRAKRKQPEKRGDKESTAFKPGRSKFGGKVSGPVIEGAEARPIVGEAAPIPTVRPPRVRRTKGRGPAKDEVEKSERYVNGQTAGGLTSHAQTMHRVKELKRLLEPLNASLLQVQSDIAHDKKVHPAIRLDAAERLLNRLHGKPKEHLELSDPDDDVPTDEVVTLLNRVLESVGAPQLEFHDSEDSPAKPAAGA